MTGTSPFPVLTVLTFWPLAAAFVVAFLPKDSQVRIATLIASVIECLLAYPLLAFRNEPGFQFLENVPWAPDWGLTYAMGVDGISILMIWLSIFTLPVCVLCSWTYIGKRVKEFHVCLLLMTTACVGVFAALDLVLFYVFWEALLIPMYLMIAIWGGDEKRYASIKFFLYTLAGSTVLLVAIVALRIQSGTFFIPDLMKADFSFRFQYWVFLAFFLAFAIKVPMFPFHTWLPAAHVQAPSAGSVILAAVLLKMGTYGFLRFSLPMTPAASEHFAPLMIAISIASILYGGLVALGQQDIKKLIAYSSVAHMGFVTLGIFLFSKEGVQGAIFQMLNHGIITGILFCLVGAIYERSHSSEINKNLGLGKFLPFFMLFWGLFGFASFGFPGTNGFVGELLVLAAAFKFKTAIGLVCIPGALLAAAYIFKVTLKMAWGEPTSVAGPAWHDLKKKEWVYLIGPAFLVVYLGLAPTGLLNVITPAIEDNLASFNARKGLVSAAAAAPSEEAPSAPAVDRSSPAALPAGLDSALAAMPGPAPSGALQAAPVSAGAVTGAAASGASGVPASGASAVPDPGVRGATGASGSLKAPDVLAAADAGGGPAASLSAVKGVENNG
ncbi:MAG: NADH-quinone oxidoreductase subunit M [Deltaproteobacteria bacterium]|jgi:NADH-quinone oxidoreductase subunit M|nr:NADH-quinone oxidoreductase subunit M [Deltaproteobacteria bacterium]